MASAPSRVPHFLFLCLCLPACTLYLGGDPDDDFRDDYDRDDRDDDDDDDDCASLGVPEAPGQALRNPQTGQCESSGGGGSCDPACGDCSGDAAEPIPTWGLCESPCTGLTEMECVTSNSCRAVYMDWCPGAGCAESLVYSDCWPTDMTGPALTDPHDPPYNPHCVGLDAQSCSVYADCSAVHANSCDQATELPEGTPSACVEGAFVSCEPEKMWCYDGDDTCGTGYSCNAATVCESPASCDSDGPGLVPCPCAGYCVADPPPES